MTITPDRIDDLDFPTPELEDEQLFDPIPLRIVSIEDGVITAEPLDPEAFQRERLGMFTDPFADPFTDDSPWQVHGTLADEGIQRDYQGRSSYCWCSPGRGMFFERYMAALEPIEWPEPITFTRWDPPLPPTPSKEIAVIQPHVF